MSFVCVIILLIWWYRRQRKGGDARNLLICWITICPFKAICLFNKICLRNFLICVRRFPVDLILSEAKEGGCRQKPLDLLNCNLSILSNLSSKRFNMCGSFSCWSAIVQGKRRGVLQKSVDFVELQFVRFEQFLFQKMSYMYFIFLLIWYCQRQY